MADTSKDWLDPPEREEVATTTEDWLDLQRQEVVELTAAIIWLDLLEQEKR